MTVQFHCAKEFYESVYTFNRSQDRLIHVQDQLIHVQDQMIHTLVDQLIHIHMSTNYIYVYIVYVYACIPIRRRLHQLIPYCQLIYTITIVLTIYSLITLKVEIWSYHPYN